MKRVIFIFLAALFVQNLSAQMDEKFYHPDKEWLNIDSIKNCSELIMFAGNDTIHSVIIKPDRQPKATTIYFHGNGGNISKWMGHVMPLVSDGFQVCMLDYRGYGKSSGIPTHLNIAHDAQMFLDTLMTMDDIKETKLIIYGASIGTQVATHLTKENNDNISALVLDGMMTSFTDVALLTTPKEYHQYVKQYATSPYSAKEDIKEIRNIRILFIHSEEDPIPIDGAHQIYESSNCEKLFWIYEGKHIEAPLRYPKTFVEYMNKLL